MCDIFTCEPVFYISHVIKSHVLFCKLFGTGPFLLTILLNAHECNDLPGEMFIQPKLGSESSRGLSLLSIPLN